MNIKEAKINKKIATWCKMRDFTIKQPPFRGKFATHLIEPHI